STLEEVAFFNPRQQRWQDHFIWTADGLRILGVTSTGRATCQRLDINDEARSPAFIQASRRIWIRMDLHPPNTDPRLADSP
ncbi:HNH endonuclease, partial [Pseudanabaenaceae cyanobacterium LEGE 13415]|nr:HNH endonuclease [Pseudanabaenaceae cyanobacterium LEGE 13415]